MIRSLCIVGVMLLLGCSGTGTASDGSPIDDKTGSGDEETRRAAHLPPEFHGSTLCRTDETVVFNCRLEDRSHLASLCGHMASDKVLGRLAFRYGEPDTPSIDVASGPGPISQTFAYGLYTRPRVSFARVMLADPDGRKWAVDSEYYGELDPAAEIQYGVTVTEGTQDPIVTPCLPGTVTDELVLVADSIDASDWLDL